MKLNSCIRISSLKIVLETWNIIVWVAGEKNTTMITGVILKDCLFFLNDSYLFVFYSYFRTF